MNERRRQRERRRRERECEGQKGRKQKVVSLKLVARMGKKKNLEKKKLVEKLMKISLFFFQKCTIDVVNYLFLPGT